MPSGEREKLQGNLERWLTIVNEHVRASTGTFDSPWKYELENQDFVRCLILMLFSNLGSQKVLEYQPRTLKGPL